MKLTPRLQAIASKIIPGSIVADIGTDHAYIPVYLLANHLSAHIIASDSRKGPLEAAAETLRLFNVAIAVDLRFGDGLSVLKPEDQVDAVVIAGMGGETICSILERGQKVLGSSAHLILQPMTETGLVRKWLTDNGFAITQEDIAQEEDNYYEIIVAQHHESLNLSDPRMLEVGPLLVSDKHPLLKPMLKQRLRRTRRAAANAAKSDSDAAKNRAIELRTRVSFLEEVLSWL